MSIGIICRSLLRETCVRFTSRVNLGGQFSPRFFSVTQKTESVAQKNFEDMKNKFNFEQFKQTQVKSFEKFKQSPAVKELFDDDTEKAWRAYNDYCVCKFNRYVQSIYGGNPATLL